MGKKPCIRYFGALHLKTLHRIKSIDITGALHLKTESQRGDNLCRKIKQNWKERCSAPKYHIL